MPGQPRNWALPLIVMPGLVPGIHVLRPSNSKDVDGRDIGVRKHAVLWTAMPSHDESKDVCESTPFFATAKPRHDDALCVVLENCGTPLIPEL